MSALPPAPGIPAEMQEESSYIECADRLKALAEPTRLQILQHLAQTTCCVTEIGNALDMDIVKVSHHLNVLRAAGVVTARKAGRESIYHLVPGVAKVDAAGDLTIDVGCCSFKMPKDAL